MLARPGVLLDGRPGRADGLVHPVVHVVRPGEVRPGGSRVAGTGQVLVEPDRLLAATVLGEHLDVPGPKRYVRRRRKPQRLRERRVAGLHVPVLAEEDGKRLVGSGPLWAPRHRRLCGLQRLRPPVGEIA